jgi:hypothetical protein
MVARRVRCQRIALLTVIASVGAATFGHAQLFRPFTDRTRAQALLEGNWQSCRESDGQYAERVYDGRWAGIEPFELHMGPYHEFGLFRGIQEEHRAHDSSENLLRPHTVELVGNNAKHVWDVNGLRLEVVLAGGSREECESWFVTLTRSGASSD